MSLIASIALAASGATLPACSWDRPGVNPFMGDVVAAVDRYTDIPADTRAKLKARMEKRDYDEMVTIQRDAIVGKANYSNDIRDMHYGSGNNVCTTVTRSKWAPKMEERGLVYCEDGQCILVPTVCRNVSRIKRIAPRPAAGGGAPVVAAAAPEPELEMEPTSAGLLGAAPGAGPTSFAQMSNIPLDSGVPTNPGPILGSEPGLPPTISPPGVPPLPPLQPGSPTTPTTPTEPTVPNPPIVPEAPNVVTPAVPEPGTWAMLLSGVAVLGFVARRRRARV